MSTVSDINKRISSLPENALVELEKYIDFLAYKHGDWSLEMSEQQSDSIKKGLSDIENKPTLPHSQIQEKMRNYLSTKL